MTNLSHLPVEPWSNHRQSAVSSVLVLKIEEYAHNFQTALMVVLFIVMKACKTNLADFPCVY
ncbi:MAG: hypothetical protein M3146_06560, partial [Thermoproteota archaeon]|nr:hypothetical protein [Thermoproteota archaeon]